MRFEGASEMDLTFAAVLIGEFESEYQIGCLPRRSSNVEIGPAYAGSMLHAGFEAAPQ
jgi:hypothetical protein